MSNRTVPPAPASPLDPLPEVAPTEAEQRAKELEASEAAAADPKPGAALNGPG